MKASSKKRMLEARTTGINAKKTAGLARVRELLRTLSPEISAKLHQTELKTGVALTNKMKTDKAIIQSPGDGMYCWNGSNAVAEPLILEKIMRLANG